MDLSKAKYILPNLFTLSSVFAGFYSMIITTRAENAKELTVAVWLVVISMVLDACDGRVARATKTQSEFGMQLDSLADAVAFGVAPGFLVYHWALQPLGGYGLFIAFAFIACGIMRLARFNVLASKDQGASAHFMGLPIPLAAGTLISVILAHLSMTGKLQTNASWSAGLMTMLLSGLMVSNVRYRTFKKVRLRGKAVVVILALATALIFASVRYNPGLAFAGILCAYIGLGILESAIGIGRGRRGLIEEVLEVAEEELSDDVHELD